MISSERNIMTYRKSWILDAWSGRMVWTLDSGRLDAWTLGDWTFGLHLQISKDHAYSIESIGSKVAILRNSMLTLTVTL